ncbi:MULTISPECIES: cupredoxin domain-containing protein [Sphingobium]|uniref:cupredoxin domain-containing protein n=1 Tax=Sphingobium TaxID=165695 RepID=UPI00159C1D02|nr:cupredoxin domain-containing protein [Sphingobium sp. 15-1]
MSHRRSLAVLAALILSSSAAAQGDPWSAARPLTISLSSFKFEPSGIMLEHDVPYRLHLVNSSSGGHDFAAAAFFAAARIRPEDAAKVRNGRIGLAGGESVDIQLIAPSSPGTYKLRCTHFMHGAFGMTGRIVVR